MESDVSQGLQDYWNECRSIEESKPPDRSLSEEENQEGECAEEREWLESAGLSEVTEPCFLSGVEVGARQLEPALHGLSWTQAQAVRRRVDLLNRTIRARRARHRPHLAQLFKDLESYSSGDSRSRSATPDSLGSEPPSPPSPPQENPPTNGLILGPIAGRALPRQEAKRRHLLVTSPNSVLPQHALFSGHTRHNGHIVASEYAEGIKMVGYQRLGSVRVRERSKSGSEPSNINQIADSPHNSHSMVCVTRSHDSLYDGSRRLSPSHVGFEELWAGDSLTSTVNDHDDVMWEDGGRTWVDFLAEEDMATLRPLIFMELTALMDSCGIQVGKTKPPKRKRKEDGVLFGVSLSTLLERDQQIVSDTNMVPLIFQKLFGELERRCLREEGLLRVAGNRQRVESLAGQLEKEFYSRPQVADHLLATATPHELTSLLKRLLRALPHPLLTAQLLPLFYLSHGVTDCVKALNLLVIMLSAEHRATLHALLCLLAAIAAHETLNKMSKHNVAMIVAPSLFPPNVLTEKNGLKAELGMAVQCCKLTELMMEMRDKLWLVPDHLVAQLRVINESNKTKENKPLSRLGGKKAVARQSAVLPEGLSEVRVSAPQFLLTPVSLHLHNQTTAGQLLLRIVDSGKEVPRSAKVTKRSDIKSRALSELAPNGNLSCLLSTGDPETALQTHFLYEVGGNIGQRRLDPNANMMVVCQNNPNAQFVVRCDHRNGSHRILRRL